MHYFCAQRNDKKTRIIFMTRKRTYKWIIFALIIIIALFLFWDTTWFFEDDTTQPADSTYLELMEQDGVRPYYPPKVPGEKYPHELD